MILDNRQVVPDIIVSRDGVPNNSMLYNVNFNNNQDGGAIVVPNVKCNGKESPRHGNKTRARDIVYATGNNNGSPRHVAHNGNVYGEPSAVGTNFRPVGQISAHSSPLHQRNPLSSYDSPLHQPRANQGDNPTLHTYGSPSHTPSKRNNQRIQSYEHARSNECIIKGIRHHSVESAPPTGSPIRLSNSHLTHRNIEVHSSNPYLHSPKKSQVANHRFSNYEHAPGSPQRAKLATELNVLQGSPSRGKISYGSGDYANAVTGSPLHKPFRPRSSSHPSEINGVRRQTFSKIPIHISSRNRQSLDNYQSRRIPPTSTISNNQKNDQTRLLNRKLSMPLPGECHNRKNDYANCLNYNKKQYPDEHNTNLSPKRLNISTRSPAKTRFYNSRKHDWKKNQEIQSKCKYPQNLKHPSLETKHWNGESSRWNWDKCNWEAIDGSDSWNIDNDKSEEENDMVNTQEYVKNRSKRSKIHQNVRCKANQNSPAIFTDMNEQVMRIETDHVSFSSGDSGFEAENSSGGSKMVLIKCKDTNYLTRIFVNEEGIHGLKVVGRVGVGGPAQDYVMNGDQSGAGAGDLNSNHSLSSDDVARSGDVINRDALSDNTASLISQGTDTEFEHEAADYQWLLDYDMPYNRYRESYSRDSLGCGRDNAPCRVSVLQTSQDQPEISYETISRNLDANLAEIDMDDFRSEDIHQLLSLPNMCSEFQDGAEGDVFTSVSGSMMHPMEFDTLDGAQCHTTQSSRCCQHQQQLRLHQHLLRQRQLHEEEQQRSRGEGEECHGTQEVEEEEEDEREEEGEEEECEEGEEEFSGVSGDLSLYQSGPLFSPLKEPPQIPPSFSVDSLDSDSIHEDLILTCQANKDNYTIAFEGSFVQFSEDSDYHVGSDSTGSGTWSTERLEGRSPGPTMTHSDQPYTTWSRVSRRSSQSHTPDPSHTSPARAPVNSPAPVHEKNHYKVNIKAPQHQQSQGEESRSNSMPNLMRRSLMKRSIEASGHCVKVYDLQNSLRSSQLSTARSSDGNNFSLVRLFIKQKSLSKEAVSLSSSFTDPSQEGACSSSDNQSGVNDSSDWPMNSQSENDMDGSASPVPPTGFTNQLNAIHSRGYRGRGNSPNIMTLNQDSSNTLTTTETSPTNTLTEGIINNNNNNSLNHIVDNVTTQISTEIDNVVSFEDSLKEPSPCSKPPMTSPIREEPEGMDISVDSRCENKVLLDQSEKESKVGEPLRLRDNKWNAEHKMSASHNKISNKNIQSKNNGSGFSESRQKSPAAETLKKTSKKDTSTQRRRQDSGNSSSGYLSNKGSTERIRRSSDSEKLGYIKDKPKPKPRSIKQMSDQCLQTSNLKVSATVNTSGILDKKDVYVYYPNYALPDLGFLKEKKYNVDARIFLVPQHYMSNPHDDNFGMESNSKRPFSCGDMEKLRRQGFSHVKDWESLNFLLPKELKEMFLDETECMETTKPSFCQPKGKKSLNADPSMTHNKGADSKGSTSSVNSAQPSSGFRGSSTLLNDSDAEIGTSADVRYIYQYDTVSTDSGGLETPPPLPKRSISLPVEGRAPPDGHYQDTNEIPPPRPPLPRGILRKCTSLKDHRSGSSSSKRHSAGDAKSSMREDLLKRRSLQEPVEYQTESLDKPSLHPNEPNEKSPTSSMRCSCVSQCTGFCGKGLKKKNLLQVNELPEVSSHEELSEEDLVKLRSQVSNFLAAKGSQVAPLIEDDSKLSCDCPRKSVSFAERICAHQQQKQNARSSNESHCKDQGDGTKSAIAESVDRDSKSSRHSFTGDEDFPPMLYDVQDKKTLVLSVRAAVEKLVFYYNSSNHQDKSKTAALSMSPEVAQITLDKLCPGIYALLSDGLLPSLHSLFGKITNSVWKVVEATSQLGPSTKALHDLVMTLNNEECLTEGPIKFNAFIFGLLNLHSLDAWLSYLRTRETSLQKHYHPEGFLYLANTAMRTLYDDLLLALRPLALLPFQLDLLHEYKALHASLLKMEERLSMQASTMENSPGDRPPLTSVSPSNPLDHLLGAKETKDFRNVAAQQDRVRALMRVLTSPEGDAHVITRDRSKSPRPRSCFEDGSNEDVNIALKKRWSGVQLGSKLLTAIDRLMIGDIGDGTSSGDYTDSLDNPRRKAMAIDLSSGYSDDGATEMRVSDISSRDGDISERSATDKDTENEKGLLLRGKMLDIDESEGEKFRRLQLKWEQMTVRPNRDSPKRGVPQTSPNGVAVAATAIPTATSGKGSRVERPDKLENGLDNSISPGCTQRSKIPRPVSMTSPQRPFKTFDPLKERHSPHQKMHKGSTSPSEGKGTPKPAPRRSLKDRVVPTDHGDHHSSSSRGGVRSKTGSRTTSSNVASGIRASSVPGRGMERATSLSRIVQTLHHRMATDNGHLSFNRGDVLTVIVEVDEKYLLCCLRDRKGLVPRSSVIACHQ